MNTYTYDKLMARADSLTTQKTELLSYSRQVQNNLGVTYAIEKINNELANIKTQLNTVISG